MFHILRSTAPKLTEHALVAIDFENDPTTGRFTHAHIYSLDPLLDLHFTEPEPLFEWLLAARDPKNKKQVPFILVGFNWGYDEVFLSPIMADEKTKRVGARFISGKLKNGIKLLDLCNHVDGALEDWIGYLNMEAEHGIVKLPLEQIEARNRFDAMATYHLGMFLQSFYLDEMQVPFGVTVGTTALALFQSRFFDHYWYRSPEQQWLNDYERKAYRGGRVECFERGLIEHRAYDVNSMYLSVMRDELIPDPITAQYVNGSKDFTSNIQKYLCIVNCRIVIPKSKIAVLPYVDTNGKLIFPLGEIEGYWTSIELLEAIKQGARTTRVYSYIYYRQCSPYFHDFAEFVWSKRVEYKAKGNVGMDKMIKKIGNTLYGKFGQSNGVDGYCGKLADWEGVIPEKCVPSLIDGVEYISIPATTKEDAQHTFPCVAVFIASYARLKLYKAMKANEKAMVYCDTDSLKLHGEPVGVTVGKNLGEWGYEGKEKCIFFKPKMYGKKCKGVPKRATVVLETDDAITFRYEKPRRYKEAIRQSKAMNQWYEVIKIVSKADDKREWRGSFSMPLTIYAILNNGGPT